MTSGRRLQPFSHRVKRGSGRTVEALLEGFQSRYKALLFRNMAICVVELD